MALADSCSFGIALFEVTLIQVEAVYKRYIDDAFVWNTSDDTFGLAIYDRPIVLIDFLVYKILRGR